MGMRPTWVWALAIGLHGCSGAAAADAGSATGAAGTSTSTGGGSSGGGGSAPTLSGSCTVTQIDCAGSPYPSANTIVYDFSPPTGEATTANGCTYTVPAAVAYTGADAFSFAPQGATSCDPQGCIAACGSHGGSVVHFTYSQAGTTLTLMSSDDPICGAANGPTQPTVLTCVQQ